jgi:sigma-54 specific flagellar transcriptional regulator A
LPERGIDLRAAVEQYENQLIVQALERTGRNKNRAAQLLGLNRTTLVEMLKRKGI